MPNIDDFKSKLTGGGARANLFEVKLEWPNSNSSQKADASFLVKATTLPSSQIENIPLAYRGRMLNIAGDRTYENWSVTVINDNNMSIRTAMEEWMNIINNNVANVSSSFSPLDYYRNLSVTQLDRRERKGKKYLFSNAYPTKVSAIELSYEENNKIQEFTVEFAYQYWTSTFGASE
tara:strand:- start:707 stop:1237 length:531 start_codon:yes stop_codon:yes gene_type:complete